MGGFKNSDSVTYPALSVVIPSHNKAKELSTTLFSLSRQSIVQEGGLEIIVVDDSSSDAPEAVVSQYLDNLPLLYKRVEVSSAGAARNAGALLARGKVLAFLDADVPVSTTWASSHLRAVLRGERVVSLGKILATEWTLEQWKAHFGDSSGFNNIDILARRLLTSSVCDVREKKLSQADDPQWTFLWSGNIALRRTLFESIGGFDDSFQGKGSEDLELGFRLSKNGAAFSFSPQAIGIHIPHPRDRTKETMLDRENVFKFLNKWPDLEVEVLVAFDCVNQPAAYAWLKNFLQKNIPFSLSKPFLWENLRYLLSNTRAIMMGDPNQIAVGTSGNANLISPLTLPGVELRLLGMHTPFMDKEFDTALLLPPLDRLPWRWLGRILKEASRIASKVFLLSSTCLDAIPDTRQEFDYPYWEKVVGKFCPSKGKTYFSEMSRLGQYILQEVRIA